MAWTVDRSSQYPGIAKMIGKTGENWDRILRHTEGEQAAHKMLANKPFARVADATYAAHNGAFLAFFGEVYEMDGAMFASFVRLMLRKHASVLETIHFKAKIGQLYFGIL
jgi:hypothetical protein